MARPDTRELVVSAVANAEHDTDGFKYVRDETAITSIDAVKAAVVSLEAAVALVEVAVDLTTAEVKKTHRLEASRGNLSGVVAVSKFGRNTEIDSGVSADIWDGGKTVGALPAGSSLIWVAPTAAAVHNLTSTSSSDDGDPVGVGARTVLIYGLTDWDTSEVSETVILNGTSNVATANSYVIIYRMEVKTSGGTNINVGTITATATAPSATTVTARIEVGAGQTQMALFAIPSTQKLYMSSYYASLNKGGATAIADINLCVNLEPNNQLINFVVKSTVGITSTGTSHFHHGFAWPLELVGPCIVKLQAKSGTNNADIAAGFDLVRIDN